MKHIALLRRSVALAALIAIVSCSGGSHAGLPVTVPASGGGGATTSQSVSTLRPSAAFTSTATLIGPATTIDSLVLHVVPNLQNPTGLAQYAQAVSDPNNGLYRRFLGPSDIAARFGATSADYAAVANYFASYGLKVGGWPQRLALTVAGPRQSFERALGTTFAFYRSREGHTLLAPQGSVQFSRPIPVNSIAGAVMDPQARWRNSVRGTGGPTQQLLSGATPQEMAAAFDYDSAYNAGFTGAGIKIGIIGTGPVDPRDFATYKAQYAWSGSAALTLPPVSAQAAANTGGSPTATPPLPTAPCTTSNSPYVSPSESPTSTCNPEDGEAQLDTEQAALARDATIEFYLAYVPVECNTAFEATCSPDPNTGLGYDYQGLAESDDEIQQIIADDTADVVSGSYGGPEVFEGGDDENALGGFNPSDLETMEMASMTAEGMAVFFSSGDQGAQTCAPYSLGDIADLQCVTYPASDSNVTAVGGVTIALSNAGTLLGPITGWGQQTNSSSDSGASGGGVSCYFAAPAWQVQPSYERGSLLTTAGSTACSAAALSGGGRVLPDVSLEGDPLTGVAVVGNVAFGQTQSPYGGTSVAAPQMAAMWALVLQACAQNSHCATAGGSKPYRLGNAAPLLWRLYQTQSSYNATMYDVTFGNNGQVACQLQGSCPSPQPTADPGYAAGAGWDGVTGLGVPFARHLISAIAGL